MSDETNTSTDMILHAEGRELLALARQAVGNPLDGLDLGGSRASLPMCNFNKDSKVWVSELDGSEFKTPIPFRLLYAETWYIDWPKGPDGKNLLDGSPPLFKSKDKSAVAAYFPVETNKWGRQESVSWRARHYLCLVLFKDADYPMVIDITGGSAGNGERFLRAAQLKRIRGVDGLDGEVADSYTQIWEMDGHPEVSVTNGAKYTQHTFRFLGFNTDAAAIRSLIPFIQQAKEVGLGGDEIIPEGLAPIELDENGEPKLPF